MAEETDPFESAWLKFGRAVKHGQALEAEIDAFADDPDRHSRFTTSKQYDAKRHCIVLSLTTIEPLPPLWGLMLGDIVHNYRSALDHIAWALVGRGRTPPAILDERERQAVSFPLATTPDYFNTCLKGTKRRPARLPGVRRADIAIVRRYQPYMGGKRNLSRHSLAILATLSNHDKHRTVQPIQALPSWATYEIGETRDFIVTRMSPQARRTPLEVGTELARFYGRRTGPNPDVEMKGHLEGDPAINESLWLGNWLDATGVFIKKLLREFSQQPRGLAERVTGTLP